jgi:octaprenyl-diphosphate synthase
MFWDFSNSLACVLTGDYMYVKTLWLYSMYGSMKSIQIVSRAVMDMSQGQVLELKSIGNLIDEKTYFEIIDRKTGVLFGASMAVGALSAQSEDYEEFYRIGIRIGRTFQLIDDALNYAGSQEKLGKPVGNDLQEGKCTYPLISVLGKLHVEDVKSSLRNGNVEWLRQKVIELGGVENTYERAKLEVQQALDDLYRIAGKDAFEVLSPLITSVVNRER